MQKYFDDDWLSPLVENQKLRKYVWRLSKRAQRRMREIKADHLQTCDRNAAIARMNLGSNPYVALSGGVDSQSACLMLQQANVDFTCAILVFENQFNSMDVDSALAFCEKHDFKYITINLEVLPFLARKMKDYVTKYECPSPQISTHLWLYEQLKDVYQATSIIAGGNAPFRQAGEWQFGSSRSQSAWMKFKEIHDFNIIGNFIGHNLEIALMFMLATPEAPASDTVEESRYESKLEGMYKLGLNVTPQDQKFTGFEKIKAHLQEMTGDGWMFEKSFRYPYQKIMEEYGSIIRMPEDISNKLLALNSELND